MISSQYLQVRFRATSGIWKSWIAIDGAPGIIGLSVQSISVTPRKQADLVGAGSTEHPANSGIQSQHTTSHGHLILG